MCLWRKMTKMMFALQCCDEVEFESCLILYPGQPCISGRSLELEAPWNCWERCCWARRLNYSRLYWPFLFHHYKPDKIREMLTSLSTNLSGYCLQSLLSSSFCWKNLASSNQFNWMPSHDCRADTNHSFCFAQPAALQMHHSVFVWNFTVGMNG